MSADNGWQPISTAPLDGRILVGWFDDGEWSVRAAWWDDKFSFGWDDGADEGYDIGAWTDGAIADFGMEQIHSYEPTHWMPLPPAPVQS